MVKRERRTRPFCGRPLLARFLLVLLACLLPAAAYSEEAEDNGKEKDKEKVETEHIFGFTEGTDIGEKGEAEFESTTEFWLGKPGKYAAVYNESSYRNVLFDGSASPSASCRIISTFAACRNSQTATSST